MSRFKLALFLSLPLLLVLSLVFVNLTQKVSAQVTNECFPSSGNIIEDTSNPYSQTTPDGSNITRVFVRTTFGTCTSTDTNGQFGDCQFFVSGLGTPSAQVFSEFCPVEYVKFAYFSTNPTPSPSVTPTPTPTPPPCGQDREDSQPCPTPNPSPTPDPSTPPPPPPGPPGPPPPPVCNDPKPQTPVLYSANRVSPTNAKLSWSKISGVNSYSIVYGPSKDNYTFGVASTGDTDNFNIGNLDPKTNYCFRVRAINGCNSSDPSNEICFSNAKRGEVLGVSTLAATGNFASGLGALSQTAGIILTSLGGIYYAKKNKKRA